MLNNVFINIIMFKYALIFIGGNVMNKGFTLAEVLITLGIIGAVAAMTIPNLIQSYKEKEYTAKLKKFYSVMENAGRLVEEEYGSVDSWGLSNSF